jgi:hypothetical protein
LFYTNLNQDNRRVEMTGVKKFVGIVASVLSMGTMVLSPVIVSAQGASGVRVSPTRAEETVNQGESSTANFSVKNVTGAQVKIVAELNDFDPQDDGTPKPLKINEHNTATLKDIVTLPADKILEPNEEASMPVVLNVSSTQAPGSYYGLVLYKAVPLGEQGPGQVSLTGSVAGIILVNVPGQVSESMSLVSIQAGKRTAGSSTEIRFSNVFAQPFDNVQIMLKNTGNSFLKPYGRVVVKNMQGKQVAAYELNDTDPKSNVLPNSKRSFTTAIQGVKVPGKYTIEAAVSYSTGGDVLTQKVAVWYLPVWLVAVVVVLVAAVVFAILRMLKGKSRK